ncbi:MAG: hypothetical protein ACI857_000279 [Arenicella sp.]|jgi:hypothetical protein
MIGRLNSLFVISVLLFSCAAPEKEDCDDCAIETDTIETIVDSQGELNSKYMDAGLVKSDYVNLGGEDGNISVRDNFEEFEMLQYEGLMTGAHYAEGGFNLEFEPYSYWDDEMEEEVKSPYDFRTTIYITKEQNEYLDFVDFTYETNEIAWDFFECVFEINFYLKGTTSIPLKFSNMGKLNWDG